MSSPSALPSLLKAKDSQSVYEMSTTLRERLKKCGRYHPGNSSSQRPTDTATGLNSPHSRIAKDVGVGVQESETCSEAKPDSETPKRKKSGTLTNITATQSNTDIIKRRKLDCIEGFLDTNISDGCQVTVELSSSSCLQKLVGNDPKLKTLRESENLTTETSLSCSSPVINHYDEGNVIYSCSSVTECGLPSGNNSPDQNYASLKSIRAQLESDLKVKDEQLRKLKMVKMYREKNDLTELQRLINIWRDVSQRALVDLHDLQPSPRPSMTELVNHLQIDHDLVHYVADEEMFS